jgi:hypothetical protein
MFPEPHPPQLLWFETLAITSSWNQVQAKRLVIFLEPETVGGRRFDPGPQPRQVVLASGCRLAGTALDNPTRVRSRGDGVPGECGAGSWTAPLSGNC